MKNLNEFRRNLNLSEGCDQGRLLEIEIDCFCNTLCTYVFGYGVVLQVEYVPLSGSVAPLDRTLYKSYDRYINT